MSFHKRSPGFTLVELIFVIGIIAILAAIAIPAYTGFIQKAKETAAVSYISKLIKAEEVYRINTPGNSYSGDFDALETTGLINPSTGAASRVEHEYRFDIVSGVDGSGNPYWTATATPVQPGASKRWFYADSTGVIRYSVGGPATSSSPPI